MAKKNSGAQANSIRVSQGAYQKALLKTVVVNLTLAILGLLLIYLCFAATVARVVVSDSGFVPVKNNTYPGGELPRNSQVLVLLGDQVAGEGTMDRLKQSFLPQSPSAIVSVEAGPVAKTVKWTEGILTVDGRPLSVPVAEDPGLEFLAGQYVSVCVSGACTPGSLIVFTPEQIVGVPFAQNAEVPKAAPASKGGGLNRESAEQVVRASVIESYNGNTKLACSLYTQKGLTELGGQDGCEASSEFIKTFLGRDFDFSTGFISKVKSEADKAATVSYILTKDGKTLVTVDVDLVRGKEGWAIDSERTE